MVLRLVGDGVCELLGGRGGDERQFPLDPQHSLPPFLHHGLKWGGGGGAGFPVSTTGKTYTMLHHGPGIPAR